MASAVAERANVSESDADFARRLQEEERSRMYQMHQQAHQNYQPPAPIAPLLNQPDAGPQGAAAPPPRQVGQQVGAIQRNLIDALRSDGMRGNRWVILFTIALGIGEIALTVGFCVASWSSCDTTQGRKPGDVGMGMDLKTWLLVYSLRHMMYIPLQIMRYRIGSRSRLPEGEVEPRVRSIMKTMNTLSLGMFVWFFIGQSLVFNTENYPESCRLLWSYALALTILVYVAMLFPLVLLALICLCLPCALLILRYVWRTGGGASNRDLQSNIQTFIYRGPESWEQAVGAPLTDEAPQCPISMTEFEDGDECIILPCKHVLSKQAGEHWLRIKKICPLCRRDITLAPDPEEPERDENDEGTSLL